MNKIRTLSFAFALVLAACSTEEADSATDADSSLDEDTEESSTGDAPGEDATQGLEDGDSASDDDVDVAGDDDTGEDADAEPPAPFVPRGCVNPGEPTKLGELPAVIDELSGLAYTREHGEPLLWGHNDSGDTARIFGLSMEGELLVTVHLNVTARDFEDIAVGPCGDKVCIYVADTGDNRKHHPSVWIHRFAVPELGERGEEPLELHVDPESTEYTYADGARDAEALAIDEREGVWIFDKLAGQSRAWHGPFAPGETLVLQSPGELEIQHLAAMGSEIVTGADWSTERSTLIIRTYAGIGEFVIPAGLMPTTLRPCCRPS